MPLWLSNLLLAAAALVILYLAYRILTNKRWIRLYGFLGLATAYFAAPALKIAIKVYGLDKKYGFDVDTAWNESSWTKDAVAALIFYLLFILENNFTKGEAHDKYFHDFQAVVIDSVRDGLSNDEISKKHKILKEKVQAILVCIAWLESTTHKRKNSNRSNRGTKP